MKTFLKVSLITLLFVSLAAVTIDNPAPGFFSTSLCAGDCTVKNIIGEIIRLFLGFVGVIALAYIIIGGYQIVTAGGASDKAEKGKKTLTNAIIGLVIIILSYTIISVITNAAFGTIK